jgi:hypothetical protein
MALPATFSSESKQISFVLDTVSKPLLVDYGPQASYRFLVLDTQTRQMNLHKSVLHVATESGATAPG